MSWIVAFALAILAFVLLSVSMKKHQRAVFGTALQPEQSLLFHRFGRGMLAACLIWCMALFRWDFGMVIFTAVTTLSALISIWFVTFRPSTFRFLQSVGRKSEDSASAP